MKNKIKSAIKRNVDSMMVLRAFSAMVVIVLVSAFGYNQIIDLYDRLQFSSFEKASQSDFFEVTSVAPLKTVYKVGEVPQFYFVSEYKLAGEVTGLNTLRCDHFRSNPFTASAFIPFATKYNHDVYSLRPFNFGGNLPLITTYNCELHTSIKFCDEKYNICKSGKFVSSPTFDVVE